MKNTFITYCIALFIFLMISCGGSEYSHEGAEETSTAAETATGAASNDDESSYSGNTVVGVVHEVTDFAKWEKAYTEKSDPQARIGYIQSIDDPNLVAVFEFTKSHDAAKARFEDPEFKQVMADAGVKSKPVLTFYDMKYLRSEKSPDPYRIALNHKVKDYATWKKAFDSDEQRRKEAGLTLIGMATAPDDPNLVYMMFATADLDGAKEMLASNELKKVMEEAGVIGKPNVMFWKAIESNLPVHDTE